jgi:glycosyltransferase involved in cell wall biosynthesis
MKILILNRRDIANPNGGGAELYTHEIARGLAGKYGCEVVVFSTRYPDSNAEDVIDGVRYIRKGSEISVHMWGFLYAMKMRKAFDLIIDEFNGSGFFTFILPNSILLIHQLYKEYWMRELGTKGAIPYVLEPLLLRFYRKRPVITVSRSTRDDLELLRFKNVKIVMNAIDNRYSGAVEKDPEPTLVFLGRLKSTKQPEQAIEIYKRVKMRIPEARLWIIGYGTLEDDLKKRAEGLGNVTFWGRVSEKEKFSILRRAHLLLVPSIREGFGINVIEAASAGSPAIGYNVHGLRDSIRHGETGYLVGSADEAAQKVIELLTDPAGYARMSSNCLRYSQEFDWRKKVDEFWTIIEEIKK